MENAYCEKPCIVSKNLAPKLSWKCNFPWIFWRTLILQPSSPSAGYNGRKIWIHSDNGQGTGVCILSFPNAVWVMMGYWVQMWPQDCARSSASAWHHSMEWITVWGKEEEGGINQLFRCLSWVPSWWGPGDSQNPAMCDNRLVTLDKAPRPTSVPDRSFSVGKILFRQASSLRQKTHKLQISGKLGTPCSAETVTIHQPQIKAKLVFLHHLVLKYWRETLAQSWKTAYFKFLRKLVQRTLARIKYLPHPSLCSHCSLLKDSKNFQGTRSSMDKIRCYKIPETYTLDSDSLEPLF